MLSTGIDIIMITRVEKILAEGNKFLERFFSEEEQLLFSNKPNKKAMTQTIAANFAAKEAFSKAIGTGIRGFKLCEVSVLRNEMQAPYIKLCGETSKLDQVQNKSIAISLSHTDEYAVAVVIISDK